MDRQYRNNRFTSQGKVDQDVFPTLDDTRGDNRFALQGKVDQDIYFLRIRLDVSNMQYKPAVKSESTPVHSRGGNATYTEIKAYIKEKYGLCVASLYIAQIKGKFGVETYGIITY